MTAHYIPDDRFPMTLAPGVRMLGNYYFNLFLVTGSLGSALFEAGVSAVADRVISQMEALGVEPDHIIPSHPHSDHITGLPALMDRYPQARVMAADGAKEFIAHPKAGPLMFKEDAFMSRSLANLGIPPGRPPLDRLPNLDRAVIVRDRHRLDLGGITLELILADGHSPGSLLGFVPDRKILFCSDNLGFHFPGRKFLPLFFTGAGRYLAMLETIKALEPSVICPAHQGPLVGKEADDAVRKCLNTTKELIARLKSSPISDEILADSLFEDNYRDEFRLYTPDNIRNCMRLLVKRSREAAV